MQFVNVIVIVVLTLKRFTAIFAKMSRYCKCVPAPVSQSPSNRDGMVPSPGLSTVASVLAFYVVLGADRILNITSDLIRFHCIVARYDTELAYVLIMTIDIHSIAFMEHADHYFFWTMSQRRLN